MKEYFVKDLADEIIYGKTPAFTLEGFEPLVHSEKNRFAVYHIHNTTLFLTADTHNHITTVAMAESDNVQDLEKVRELLLERDYFSINEDMVARRESKEIIDRLFELKDMEALRGRIIAA